MITILRLGHRHYRDQRLTTHVALTARALGAKKVILSGEKDEKILESVTDIASRWGGSFEIVYEKNFRKVISEFKGKKLHLTMYGLPIQEKIKEIRAAKDLLIIVGSEKVPGDIYHMVDYNIAVGSQPHSEVAALAILMHEYHQGKELNIDFKNPKISLRPSKAGKDIITYP
ncbi:MAG: tRNA (cytidine(56)-2'-O)-methyltransferase [archaeon]